MNYWENRPAKNMRELFECNLAFLDFEDYNKIRAILAEADFMRLRYIQNEVKENE